MDTRKSMRVRPVWLIAGWFFLALPYVWSQEAIENTLTEDRSDVLLASSLVRSIVVEQGLDEDHDQFITLDELDNRIQSELQRARRLATRSRGIQDTQRRSAAYDDAVRSSAVFQQIQTVRLEIDDSGVAQLSLVDADFHRQFSEIEPDARNALLDADVRGNNDGTLSLKEYEDYNGRRAFRSRRFQSQYGTDAHEAVLQALAD